jgi:lycopene beta-cyclase
MTNHQYDYIITGAGAAGLSLLVRMIDSGKFSDKKILLLDKEPKTRNDRTWCFWDTGKSLFDEVICKSWQHLWFHGKDFSKLFDISPYRYNMIMGIDFYNYCFDIIRLQPNIDVRFGNVSDMQTDAKSAWVLFGNQKIASRYIFNSIIFSKAVPGKGEFYLHQHFKGWIIETAEAVFNELQATLMDFRISQHHGASFVYVMPFSPTTALVEYTLFTEKLLDSVEYDTGLKDYICNFLKCRQYNITHEEYGIIPMTNHRFPRRKGNIINIGTAGGQTKASSGYTFQFIQKDTAAIVQQLADNDGALHLRSSPKKYNFYDSVLLNVLATGKLSGKEIFSIIHWITL